MAPLIGNPFCGFEGQVPGASAFYRPPRNGSELAMRVDQRQTLATLTKPRLRELFEVDAPSALIKDDLIELLARSRRTSFEKILGELKHDTLEEAET